MNAFPPDGRSAQPDAVRPRRPIVVATHRLHEETRAALATLCELVSPVDAERLSSGEISALLPRAEALMIFMPDRVDEGLLARSPRLRVVAGALKGCDNIDVPACTGRGVWVTICPDLLTLPTAELALGLAIGLMRRLPEGDRAVRAGHAGWRPRLYGRSLIGARVGICGMGRVGRAVAGLLSGFGCEAAYADPAALPAAEAERLALRRLGWRELLARSDVLLLTAPLTPSSIHALDAQALAALPRGAIVVNVGRGSVVDEEAVAAALEQEHLGGYAADVFAFEDRSLADRPPAVPGRLLAQPERTLFTPHLGSAVERVRRDIEREAAANILAALRGEHPAGAVNEVRPVAQPAGRALPR